MRWYQTFLKRILSGIILFLFPVILLIFILGKALDLLRNLIQPIKNQLPSDSGLGSGAMTIISVFLLFLICFIAGILSESKAVKALIKKLENNLLIYIPGYAMLKSRASDAIDETDYKWRSVLLNENDAWRLAVETDRKPGGFSSVFIPNPPEARAGMLKLVPQSKLRYLDIPVSTLLRMVRKYGEESAILVDDENEKTIH